jgi:hypothetical protein
MACSRLDEVVDLAATAQLFDEGTRGGLCENLVAGAADAQTLLVQALFVW